MDINTGLPTLATAAAAADDDNGTMYLCDTVGGINTVLRTKAAVSMDEMGDQYCMIGPYVEKGVKMEVEVENPVKHEPMATIIKQMKEYGFKVC